MASSFAISAHARRQGGVAHFGPLGDFFPWKDAGSEPGGLRFQQKVNSFRVPPLR
jgi:hypothetical protein